MDLARARTSLRLRTLDASDRAHGRTDRLDAPRRLDPAGRSDARGEPVAVLDEERPEDAVAYAEDWILERLREHGLVLTGLHPGSWCGREEFMGFQDLPVAVRDA